MGILEYIWPYEKKFSEIPGTREAGIVAFIAGPTLGALTIALKGTPRYAFKTTTYSTFVIFWVAFIYTRTQYTIQTVAQEKFVKAYRAGEID